MQPPIQAIAVNGSWQTDSGAVLNPVCEEQYYNSFRQSASNVIQAVNILLGVELCTGMQDMHILQFNSDFKYIDHGASTC